MYRAGTGEPLVLVHGFTATWRCWLPVIPETVAHFEVIAPTLHGHDGGPVPPQGARSLIEAGDHFESLLDSLGVETAHFAGNSMGGALSLEMAKRGRARTVVAISPGGGWATDDRAEGERIITWFARNQKLARRTVRAMPRLMRRPGMRRLLLRDVMTRGDQVPVQEAVRLVESSVRCSVVDDVFDTIRSGTALLSDLGRIECPVLVVWGAKDRILPIDRHAARFRTEVPGAEFRVLPGVGHTPMWDDPDLISAVIRDFAQAAQVSAAAMTPAATPASA